MKIIKLVLVTIISSLIFFACSKDDNTDQNNNDEVVITDDPEEEAAVIVGKWHFVKIIGLEDDNKTEYDIDAKIVKLKKAIAEGGLSTDEIRAINYVLIRLVDAKENAANDLFIFEEGGVGKIHYIDEKYADSEMTWEEISPNAFKIDFGGGYHLTYTFRIASNNASGYYLYRDYDVDGPNLKIFVEKRE